MRHWKLQPAIRQSYKIFQSTCNSLTFRRVPICLIKVWWQGVINAVKNGKYIQIQKNVIFVTQKIYAGESQDQNLWVNYWKVQAFFPMLLTVTSSSCEAANALNMCRIKVCIPIIPFCKFFADKKVCKRKIAKDDQLNLNNTVGRLKSELSWANFYRLWVSLSLSDIRVRQNKPRKESTVYSLVFGPHEASPLPLIC